MPLRECRECGKEVSSLAPACPHCGVPSSALAKSFGGICSAKSTCHPGAKSGRVNCRAAEARPLQALCECTPAALAMPVEPVGPCPNQGSQSAGVDIDDITIDRSILTQGLDRNRMTSSF